MKLSKNTSSDLAASSLILSLFVSVYVLVLQFNLEMQKLFVSFFIVLGSKLVLWFSDMIG